MNTSGPAQAMVLLLAVCATMSCSGESSGVPESLSVSRAALSVCTTESTLTALVNCITLRMPQRESEGYRVPTTSERTAYRAVVKQMLAGKCDDIVMPTELAMAMQVRTFADSANGRRYCVLYEIADDNLDGFVDRGWGTFVVDPNAARQLVHSAPHIRADITTEIQAVELFRSSRSRALVIAGAHRDANRATSSCQRDFRIADAAHNVTAMHEVVVEELSAFYGGAVWTLLDWHGMSVTTCPKVNVYLSPGVIASPPAGAKVLALRDRLRAAHPSWTIEVPSSKPVCEQNGTNNTYGRFLNGVSPANVCSTAATSASGRYIQIEQQPDYRKPSDWATAINEAFPDSNEPPPPPPPPPPPRDPAPPAAPTNLKIGGGAKFITLSWSASAGATSYSVHRSTVSGEPYTPIKEGLTTTSYKDAGLTSRVRYCYVVTAHNENGASAFSAERCREAR